MKTNENYIHNCGIKEKFNIEENVKSLIEIGYSNEELLNIVDFYVLHAISKNNNKFGLKTLHDYSWHGRTELSKLEGLLLKSSGINMFVIIKSNTINDTLEQMDLKDKICTNHPRAVLKQNYSLKINEDGSVDITQAENRMECLFRHIRNSLAHNQLYKFNNDNILLEDSENDIITARIFMNKNVLLKWIEDVKNKT